MSLFPPASEVDARRWRALLILGRVSNLPTVWSNCVAGWLLGGGARYVLLAWTLLGGTLLYVGGMFLNDAFDEDFDRQYRPERPIPSGAITPKEVWFIGVGLLVLGLYCVVWISPAAAVLALSLATCVLVYDALHKKILFAPVLMALCRFFLILLASAAGVSGVTGLALWTAIVLAAYIVGLSYIARRESSGGQIRAWPCLFLALPLLLAYFVNDTGYESRFYLLSVILLLWVVRCVRCVLWTVTPNIGRAVSGLLAGIVLVDLLAIGGPSVPVTVLFFLLFTAALVFQRFVPAT